MKRSFFNTRKFTEGHIWIRNDAPSQDGNNEEWTVEIGISEYGRDELGDISLVECNDGTYGAGEAFCTIETVKTVHELSLPFKLTVIQQISDENTIQENPLEAPVCIARIDNPDEMSPDMFNEEDA